MELYTYSSLNRNFLQQYKHSLDKASQAVILYNREALSLKGNSDISEDDIRTAFERTDLQIFTNTTDFQKFIYSYPYQNDVLLLMSSGNYGDIDFSLIG